MIELKEKELLRLDLKTREAVVRGTIPYGKLHVCSNGKFGCQNPTLERDIATWLDNRRTEQLEGEAFVRRFHTKPTKAESTKEGS